MKKVFYSWQKDLMAEYRALERALQQAVADLPDWEIDRAERDPRGADDIAVEIMRKIDESDLVLADVSIVGTYSRETGQASTQRNTSNPNVLYEAGYAMRALTKDRVILIASSATTPETNHLPFDLRNRRTMIRDFGRTASLAAELKEIIAKPRPALAGRGPYIFAELGGYSGHDGMMTFFFNNEESTNWVLESVSLGGSETRVGRNLPNAARTKMVLPGLPIPPYQDQLEVISFVVSRSGDRYQVTQKLNISGRADERYGLDGFDPSPSIEPVTRPQ